MPLWATVRFVAGWMNANEATLVWVDEYSRMAEAYDKNVAPRFEPIAREVVRLAAPKPNELFLDVGTGTGLLGTHGTMTPSKDLAQVREAVRLVRTDPEAKALGDPDAVFKALDVADFDHREVVKKEFPVRFASLEELVRFAASYGWYERELKEMNPERRAAFDQELADRLQPFMRSDGMHDDAKSRYRSRRMGFVFQSYNLLPGLTAAENVELPLLVAKVPAKDARRKALVLMEQVELNGWAGHKPAQLSAGQQQRVAIARALVNDPAIVWADEPTGNLDSETSAQIMDLLVRLNREQRQTLVLVTHDAIVSSRAHRLLRMRNGQTVEETRSA